MASALWPVVSDLESAVAVVACVEPVVLLESAPLVPSTEPDTC
jgi:hypothetical protein